MEALSLIIAKPPIHLTAVFRAAKYFVTKGKPLEADSLVAGFSTLDKYQRKDVLYNLWDQWLASSDKGRVAKAIFPNIRERLRCKWVDPTSDTIRILSGHGPFGNYLYDRTLSQHPNCLTDGLRDDPNHVVFDCFDVPDAVCDIRRRVRSRSLYDAVRSETDWPILAGAFRVPVGSREVASLRLRQP